MSETIRILVDADGCPVKDIVVSIAKKYSIPVIMISDTSHVIDDDYSEVVIVGKGKDSVDHALINRVNKGDIVVTQDYGVATMALSKKAHSINQNGFLYTNDNMDQLLFQRYLGQKIRRAGGRTSNTKKRKKEDNERFKVTFEKLVSTLSKL